LVVLLLLVPVLIIIGARLGYGIRGQVSRMHPTARLAERIYLEEHSSTVGTTNASIAFRATGKTVEQLYDEAASIRDRFGTGGWLFGGFVGLVIGLRLVNASIQRCRTDYEADRASCLACGRCFAYCPREQLRLKKVGKVVSTG
jgi:hypothetical protein